MIAEPAGGEPGAVAGGPAGAAAGGPASRLELGLFLAGAHGPARTAEYGQLAERAGFEAVWLAEHHFIRYGQTPSATVLAGHLLGRTSRLLVGTAACVLSARHPVALAEEAALLATVAPGRFRLGVARGGPWAELEVFGTGLERYHNGFPEALDLLRRWLSGAARVGGPGPRFGFREVRVVPRPPQPMPVWVAATSAATVEIAAARGLPLLLGVHEDLPGKAATLRRYAATAAGYGHDPTTVPHASVHLAFAGDPGSVRPTLRAWLAGTRDYVRLDGGAPARDPAQYAEQLLAIHPVGRPEHCADRLVAAAAGLGVRHLLVMVEGAGPDRVAGQIAALGGALRSVAHSLAG